MDFNGLPESYWNAQKVRVEALRQKVSSGNSSADGRVVPDDNDLVIGAGRRLPLTILFTDISGFSNRTSLTAEQQEMNLRVFNLYFTEMIRIVEDYGGTVEKNTGDGLMAYFEDASEYGEENNSTKRALACALTMFAANEHLLSPIYQASKVSPIEFRASIEHGTITIAKLGAPRRFNANVAIGNAANFASKMLALIKANQIGLGSAAQVRLPDTWRKSWTTLSDVSTGWVFNATTTPYPLYLYTGRWSKLI
jgi:class 3 adenylate cyclase